MSQQKLNNSAVLWQSVLRYTGFCRLPCLHMHRLTGNSKLRCFTSVPNPRHLSRNEVHAGAHADLYHVTAHASCRPLGQRRTGASS